MKKFAITALLLACTLPLHANSPKFDRLEEAKLIQQSKSSYNHEEVAKLLYKYDALLNRIKEEGERSAAIRADAQKTIADAKRKSANARAITNGLLLLGTVAASGTAASVGDDYLAEDILVDGIVTTAVVDEGMRRTGDRRIDQAVDDASHLTREAQGIEQEILRWKKELHDIETELGFQRNQLLRKINGITGKVNGFEESFGKVQDLAFDESGAIQVMTFKINGQKVDVTLNQLKAYLKDNFQGLIDARQKDYDKALDIHKKALLDEGSAQQELDSWKSEYSWWARANSVVPWSKNHDKYENVKKVRSQFDSIKSTREQSEKKLLQTRELLKRAQSVQKSVSGLDSRGLKNALDEIEAL